MFIVRDEGDIPFFIHPREWDHGEEKSWCHTLVEAVPDAVDELCAIQKDVRKVAEFVLDRERPRLKIALAQREAVDDMQFAEVLAFLEQELPKLRPLWSQLDPKALPALPWKLLAQHMAQFRRKLQLLDAATLREYAHRGVPELLLLLLDPELGTFAASYDGPQALLQAAVMTLAREPLCDFGLRERVEYLQPAARALLARRATSQAFVANTTYSIVRADDAQALRERIAKRAASDQWEAQCLRDLDSALARIEGTFLMSVTQWVDFTWSVGGDSDLQDGGVWQIVKYRKQNR